MPSYDPLVIIAILVGLSVLPSMAVMVTSYMKIVVVISLLRNALGIQQIPPNTVINGIAIILSFYIMAPVVSESWAVLQPELEEGVDLKTDIPKIQKSFEPFRRFLARHSSPRHKAFFLRSAATLHPDRVEPGLDEDSFIVLIPAFTISELTEAFQIAFLIYLPFIAVDIIVSNILLAMGMMMVSPMTISLPFKLLLFVLVDGWTRLVQGLVLTYSV